MTPSELHSAIIRDPLIVTPETTVMGAIAQMSGVRVICNTTKVTDGQLEELHLEARSSCVLVVESGQLVGILTERDVVRLSAQQLHLETLAIKEVMAFPVVSLYESEFTDLFAAINLLQQYHIRHIPVLNEQDQVVGLVTHESLRQTSRPIDLLRLRLVSEVMTNQVICAAPDSSMLAIAQLMAQNRVSSVVIVQNGDIQAQSLQIPVGMITERDIVQFQAIGLHLETCLADAVMSTPIFSVKPEDSLWLVQQIMEQRLIRRLAVTGSQGELLGIVTQTNLLQALKPLELFRLAEVLEEKVLQLEVEKIKFLETRAMELEKEVAARTIAFQTKIEQQKLVTTIATQIRSSLSLQTILETTVTQVRSLLGCDRVNIWQLNSNGEVTTVAESTNSSLSLMGRQVLDTCFSQNYIEMYRQGRIRVVSDIHTVQMSNCQRDLLIELQTRAKILVPILCDQEVWGFLNATESQHPREWQESEVELLQQLSVQLAIAIQQASNHKQLQEQLSERQRAESTLQKLVIGTAAVTGEDFFPALVRHITEALNVQYALVTKLVGNQLHTLGFWANGALQQAISYHIAHTPCEFAIRDGEFYCPSQIQALFPDDFDLAKIHADSYLGIALKDDHGHAIGNLCILDVKPLPESTRKEAIAILQVFAARAAAELQRQVANEALHDLNQELEARVEQRTQELQARETQLRESEKFLQTVLDTFPLAVFWKDRQSVYLGCNQNFAAGTDLPTSTDIIGKTDYELSWGATEADLYRADDRQVMDSGIAKLGIIETQHQADGSMIWIETNKLPLRNLNGEVIGVLGTFQDITARKQAETELQRLSQRLALSLESASLGCWEWDLTENIVVWDERMYELYGITKQSDSPQPYEIWANALHPDDSAAAQAFGQEAILGQVEYDTEFRVVHPDGSVHFIKAYGVLVKDDQGNPQSMIGINFDITERKQAEQALRESQQFIQTVINTVPLPLFWKDSESVFLGCNQQLANSLNLSSPQEIVGKTDFDISLTLDQASAYRASDKLVIESGVAQLGMEEIFILPSGETRWIETHKAPLRDWANNIIGVVGMFQDISDRKEAEINLQNSELRFRRVFDSSVVGMLFADFQGQIIDANDRFLEMLGYTRDDFNAGAIDWLAMTPPEYLPADFAAMGYLLQHGFIDPWEKEYYRKDGSRLPILIGAALLPDLDNQTICVIVDISEQKAALSQRQEAELALEQQAMYKQLLLTITQAIRQTLDINVILNTAVQEARSLLVVDRVAIYRFQDDWSGEFITESVVSGWSKLVGPDVNPIWADTYLQDTQGGRFKNHETWAINDIYQANLQPCHIELLQQFQARAYVITPIFVSDSLWGLLGMYQNGEPYVWTAAEIELLEQIASQVAIAIYQANLYEQAQSELIIRQKAEGAIFRQLQQQRTLGTIVQKVRESLDIKDILSTVTQDIKDLLQSDRVIVFQLFADGKSQIVEEAVSSSLVSLKDRHWDDEIWSPEILDYYWQGQPRIVADVMTDIWTDCLVEYSLEGQIQSKIVAPILQEVRDGDNHRWVASHKNNRLWGVLVVHACLEKRVWKDSEAQLLQQIANQLAIAIQQANLFDQLQTELSERLQAEAKLTETNQKLAISNEELARATRLKDEFLANMSHELRTPLNAILGLTEVLQDDIIGTVNERQLKALKTVERSGNHLLELINDILDVAKIEAGQIELDLTAISVGHLCQSSAAFIKQQALKKNIQLHINVEDNLPNLLVDERRIRQVLINLLNNAVKFTPEGGSITLKVSQDTLNIKNSSLKPSLKIAVTDTGIGIAPENINKLFQPFIQIDSALNRQYSGTGLGLALVKRIVELHGGSVGLTSELGVGSCFTVELPCTSASEIMVNYQSTTGSTIDPSDDTTPANQAPLILLAEDNEANIITFLSYLEARGYRVLVARDGQEALDMAQIHQPDLILMDIQMPKMDGMEAMKQIRLNPHLVDTPIIALTALAMTGDSDRCLEAGANDYLTKPVKLKQLAITIQQLLKT